MNYLMLFKFPLKLLDDQRLAWVACISILRQGNVLFHPGLTDRITWNPREPHGINYWKSYSEVKCVFLWSWNISTTPHSSDKNNNKDILLWNKVVLVCAIFDRNYIHCQLIRLSSQFGGRNKLYMHVSFVYKINESLICFAPNLLQQLS